VNHPNWQVEDMADWLLFYQRGSMIKAPELHTLANDCMILANAFHRNISSFIS